MPLPTTTMSTKGQVILPKTVRESKKWVPGTKLVVEERPEGILLRAVRENPFPPTTIEEVLAMVDYKGPVITLEDMDRAITDEVNERAKRGRY
jgi:AbrB family looped-hinge helix DNA binding protein